MINYILHLIIPVAHAAEASGAASGPVALFGLNWKLFLAQLFNFIVILLVLWRWVFKPLGAKLEERSANIEKSLKNSEEIKQQLQATEHFRKAEMEKVHEQADRIIMKAHQAALQTKAEILAEAKKSGEKLLVQAQKELASEKNKMLAEVREEAATLIVTATEKIIRQKLNSEKDKELISASMEGLK